MSGSKQRWLVTVSVWAPAALLCLGACEPDRVAPIPASSTTAAPRPTISPAAASANRSSASVAAACAKPCKERGACFFDGSRCVPSGEADCKSSASCRKTGMCSLVEGPCGLGSTERCKLCRVGGDADCRGSQVCAVVGQCKAEGATAERPWGSCVVGSDEDCKSSRGCQRFGNCVRQPAPEGGYFRCTREPAAAPSSGTAAPRAGTTAAPGLPKTSP